MSHADLFCDYRILESVRGLIEYFAGVGLTVHHIRRSETCGDNGWEELEPIHQNLQYDFNFQQTVHLPELINVKPVSQIKVV